MSKKPTKVELKTEVILKAQDNVNTLKSEIIKYQARRVNEALTGIRESVILKFVPLIVIKPDNDYDQEIYSYDDGKLVIRNKDEIPGLYLRKYGDPFAYELILRESEYSFDDISPLLKNSLKDITKISDLENRLIRWAEDNNKKLMIRSAIPYGIGGLWHTQSYSLIDPLQDGLVLKRIGGKTKYEDEFVTLKPDYNIYLDNLKLEDISKK